MFQSLMQDALPTPTLTTAEGPSTVNQRLAELTSMLCYAVACPHLKRSGKSTACPRSASAHLYHADGRLTSCDGAATECI